MLIISYKNKNNFVDTAVKFVRGGEKARNNVARTYDVITKAKIWTTDVGLPMRVLEYTNDLNARLGRYKKGKPKVQDMVDFSIGKDAMKPLGMM